MFVNARGVLYTPLHSGAVYVRAGHGVRACKGQLSLVRGKVLVRARTAYELV